MVTVDSEDERRWEDSAARVEKRFPAAPWNLQTDGGIPVKAVYTSADRSLGDEDRVGMPGFVPFTRGVFPTGYRNAGWQTQQVVGFGTAEETAERLRYVIAHGQTGNRASVLNVVHDQPTLAGLDSDHPLSRGMVGKGGVAIDSLADMRTLTEAFVPDETFLSIVAMGTAPILFAMYCASALERGVGLTDLAGVMLNDPLTSNWGARTHILPPRPSARLVTHVIEFCHDRVPRWNSLGISGYHAREAGATPEQEIAFTLAAGIAYVEAGVARGMDPEEFVARFSFFFEVHNDFFEEIAKLRAARRMWATELTRRFGVTNPRALALRCHVQTAGSSCTAQEPENNIVRTAVQALAAILAGTNGLHTNAMDEALAIPTETSARIALRTQQILRDEMGLTRVADPLGGSWFVETLTDDIEQRAMAELDMLEKRGDSMLDAIEGSVDWINDRIRQEAWRAQQLVESGRRPVIAVNRFVDPDAELRIDLFEHDEALEEKQLRRLAAWKRERNGRSVAGSLNDLLSACAGDANLMEPILAAVTAGATVGEVTSVLQEGLAFGDGPAA